MGHGASNFSSEEKTQISQSLKTKYDTLAASGMEEDKIREELHKFVLILDIVYAWFDIKLTSHVSEYRYWF